MRIVTMLGPEGERQMPLAEFFVGPRKTALKPDELLARYLIPKENLGKPTHFLKFGLRKGQALALVNVGGQHLGRLGQTDVHRAADGARRRRAEGHSCDYGESLTSKGARLRPRRWQRRAGWRRATPSRSATCALRPNTGAISIAVLTKRTLEGAYELAKAKRAEKKTWRR